MRSPVGQFTASACNFVSWDVQGAGSAAIQLEAGRAIVQGCTFAQEGPHVQVAETVVSALLTGNQAAGGFVVENRAGKRTELLANESSSVEWTDEARKHYRIVVGAEGDGKYVRRWHGRESGPMRWSGAESELNLPVVPNERYRLTLKLNVPKAALSPNAGLYLDGKRLALFSAGTATLNVDLPLCKAEEITLKIVCAGWVPSRIHSACKDGRTLGVQLSEIIMQGKGGGKRVFQANTGEWK
jgi:hypothetical protein